MTEPLRISNDSSENSRRLFIGVELDETVKEKLALLASGLTGKKTTLENFHITLHFIGEVDNESTMETIRNCEELPLPENPIAIQVNVIGHFQKRNQFILWAGMSKESISLSELAEVAGNQLKP